jgi:tetratricopeptide (TPR) repeat protein
LRNSILLVAVGLLVGYIAGFLTQEMVALQQTPRQPPAVTGAGPAGGGGPAGPAGNPQAGQAGMEQVQQLRAYVAENPDDADAVLQLASLNFQIQQWPRAAELLEQYMELRPDDADALSELAVTYRGMGQFDKAVETFDRVQQMQPDHWRSRFNEAVVLAIDLGDFEAADRVMAELEELQPGNPDVERLAEEIERRRTSGGP